MALTILIDCRTGEQSQDGVPVTPGVGKPLQDQHARTFGPARAIGFGGKGLAPAIRSQTALPAELDEGAGRRHHGDASGKRESTLTAPQRLGRQMESDQR